MKKIKNSNLPAVFVLLLWLFFALGTPEVQKNCTADDYFHWTKENISISSQPGGTLFDGVTLPRGQYRIGFTYTSSEEISLSVYSRAEYDLETDYYKVHARYNLPAGENADFTFVFTIDKPAVNICISAAGDKIFDFQATDALIETTTRCYSDSYIYSVFYLLSVTAVCIRAYICLKNNDKNGKTGFIVLCCLVTVCLLTNLVYFTQATPHGHDMYFHLRRVEGLAGNIISGHSFRKINTVFNSGYGYINPVMYPQLLLYIPALLVCAGMSAIGAIKLFYIVVNIATVLISYYAFSRISNNRMLGVCLSAVYSLSYYRLQTIYIRSAMGEALFLAFLPLAVYGLYTIMYTNRKRWLLFALAVSAVIQSHVLGSLLMIIFLCAEFVISAIDLFRRKKFTADIIKNCVKAVLFTVFVNLWFVVPFVYFYITQDMYMFDKGEQLHYFILQAIPLGSMLSLKTVKTAIVENMGTLLMAGLAMSTAIYAYIMAKHPGKRLVATLSYLSAVVYGILCTDIVPWQIMAAIPLVNSFMAAIQFSFRFYGLFICAICLFAAKYYSYLPPVKFRHLITTVIMAVAVVSTPVLYSEGGINKDNLRYYPYYYKAPNEYLMQGAVYTGTPHMVMHSEDIDIISCHKNGDRINIEFNKTSTGESYIQLPLFYYYGYQAEDVTGATVPLKASDNGYIAVNVNQPGTHKVDIYYDNMRGIYLYSAVISALFTVVFLLYNTYRKFQTTDV